MNIAMVRRRGWWDGTTIAIGGMTLVAALAMIGWSYGVRLVELRHFGLLLLHNLGLLALLLVAVFGFGVPAVHGVGLHNRAAPEFYLFSLALGLGILAHLMLGLGALGLLYQGAAWTLLVAGMLLGLLELVRYRTAYRDALDQIRLPERITWFTVLLTLLLIVNCLYPLLADALVPPLNWDEIAYHLAIPKIYVQHHAITYIPFIPYSNWPLETEMLFTLGLLLPSETLPHLISWACLLMTCWGLYLLGRRYFSVQVGLLAAVIFSATPMVGTLAGTALVELPLTLYTFLATFAFLIWLETCENSAWMLSALSGGLAAATKLNGALVSLVLGVLIVIAGLMRRQVQLKALAIRFVLFGLLAFAVVAPWYVKCWIQTGNPFWPFLQDTLGGRDWDALGSEYLLGFIRLPNMPTTPTNWLLGLWYLTFQAERFGPQRVVLGWHYLAMLPFVLPALFFIKPAYRRTLRWLSTMGIIYYTVWFFQTHQARFLMPTIPVLALLAASGALWLGEVRQTIWRTLVQGVLVLSLTLACWLARPADRAHVGSRWSFLSGQTTRQAFLLTQAPGYATYSYANEHLPSDAYVLLALYESRGYYLDRDYVWANPISQRILRLEQFTDADQLAAELHTRGFTHVIFRPARLNNYTYIRHGEAITQLTRALLAEHAHLMYTSSELELYELLP